MNISKTKKIYKWKNSIQLSLHRCYIHQYFYAKLISGTATEIGHKEFMCLRLNNLTCLELFLCQAGTANW